MYTGATDPIPSDALVKNDDDGHRSDVFATGSALWPRQPPKDPEGLGPRACREYAKLISDYWLSCRLSAEIDPNFCLDIVDLAPGSGLSVWLMVQALRRQLGAQYRWRYLPMAPRLTWFDPLYASQELSALIGSGALVPLLWDPFRGDPCLIHPDGRHPWKVENPVVILAHDRFSYLGQRLLAAHYGKLMVAEMPVHEFEPGQNRNDGDANAISWRIFDHFSEGMPDPAGMDALMGRYLATFNSSPLPFPEGALRLIDAISRLASRGHLMLSKAKGFGCETSLRLGSFSNLLQQWCESKTLPVNFHMIAHCYASSGGSACSIEIRQGEVLQIALGSHSDAAERLQHLSARLDPWLADPPSSLEEAMRSLGGAPSLPVRLALLRLSEFDPVVFISDDRALTAELANASWSGTLDRAAWSDALERVWLNHLPGLHPVNLHQQLSVAAMHCGVWSLAKRAINRGMQFSGKNATDLANLAWCENRTGDADKGLQLTEEALKLDNGNALALEVYRRISEKLLDRDLRWRCALQHAQSEMILEPLHISHAEAFYFQYRDPQIAIMTGLPPIKSLEEARGWISEQSSDPAKVNYAIMLPDEGFAGFINLAVSAHAAFFCFWTGVDFQGRGLAARAGELACDHAARLGVPVILTSAFQDNQRSLRALRRMGFQELPIRALAPDHDRIFFIRCADGGVRVNGSRELVEYYAREQLEVYFPSLVPDEPTHMLKEGEMS